MKGADSTFFFSCSQSKLSKISIISYPYTTPDIATQQPRYLVWTTYPDGSTGWQQIAQRVQVMGVGEIDSLNYRGCLQRPFRGLL